jgi:purine-binding chemotaxis protein CheW
MSGGQRERQGFDWAELGRRLEASGAALAALGADDPQAHQRLLRARAAALAALPASAAQRAPAGIEVLAFHCAGERYAFETAWVARVLPMPALTPIPNVPAFIAGVAMCDGEVLAVLDLRVLLALPLSDLSEPVALIVLRGEDSCFAVLADAIGGVQHFPQDGLGHCLPALAELDDSYLLGVAPDRTALLDAHRLLTDSTLVVDGDR